jgi:hypothetical protein
VFAAVGMAGVALWASTQAGNREHDQVENLSRQLSRATAQIESARQTSAERASCDRLFAETNDNSFKAYVSNIGDLIVIISTSPPQPGTPERDAAVAVGITELRGANAAFRAVADQHAQWLDAGQPLPCPIQPKGTPI